MEGLPERKAATPSVQAAPHDDSDPPWGAAP